MKIYIGECNEIVFKFNILCVCKTAKGEQCKYSEKGETGKCANNRDLDYCLNMFSSMESKKEYLAKEEKQKIIEYFIEKRLKNK